MSSNEISNLRQNGGSLQARFRRTVSYESPRNVSKRMVTRLVFEHAPIEESDYERRSAFTLVEVRVVVLSGVQRRLKAQSSNSS